MNKLEDIQPVAYKRTRISNGEEEYFDTMSVNHILLFDWEPLYSKEQMVEFRKESDRVLKQQILDIQYGLMDLLKSSAETFASANSMLNSINDIKFERTHD